MGVSMIGIIGFSMLLSGASPGVQYAGTFLGALGIYPTVPNTITWIANNSEGVYKRGITIGIVNGWGNLNGIVSSNIYRPQDKPNYRLGHGIVLAYMVFFLLGGSALQYVLLRNENAKRLAGKRDYLVEGKTEQEIEELGDRRYVFNVIVLDYEFTVDLITKYVQQAWIYLHPLGFASSPHCAFPMKKPIAFLLERLYRTTR